MSGIPPTCTLGETPPPSIQSEASARTCLYHHGAAPAVARDQPADQRRHHEGADAGAADGDAGGQRAPLVEVEPGRDHRWQVDHAEAHACDQGGRRVTETREPGATV